jgi:hypothetical protein
VSASKHVGNWGDCFLPALAMSTKYSSFPSHISPIAVTQWEMIVMDLGDPGSLASRCMSAI